MKIARGRVAGKITYGIVHDDSFVALPGDPFGKLDTTGSAVDLHAVELLPPVKPSRVLVILGGFLRDDESATTQVEPRLFPKVVSGHLGPGAVIPRPSVLTGDLMMEAELALVVGQRVHNVDVDEAWDAILGFTAYNDVTAAEFVPADLYRAKSMDGFSAFGPWISTDLHRNDIRSGLAITGRVNGNVVQRGNTARFKFDPGQVLSHASRYVTLQPGDVIPLGTPPPPARLMPDDIVEVEVEGIGTLRNIAG